MFLSVSWTIPVQNLQYFPLEIHSDIPTLANRTFLHLMDSLRVNTPHTHTFVIIVFSGISHITVSKRPTNALLTLHFPSSNRNVLLPVARIDKSCCVFFVLRKIYWFVCVCGNFGNEHIKLANTLQNGEISNGLLKVMVTVWVYD